MGARLDFHVRTAFNFVLFGRFGQKFGRSVGRTWHAEYRCIDSEYYLKHDRSELSGFMARVPWRFSLFGSFISNLLLIPNQTHWVQVDHQSPSGYSPGVD
jgi:hypothetical protein